MPRTIRQRLLILLLILCFGIVPGSQTPWSMAIELYTNFDSEVSNHVAETVMTRSLKSPTMVICL